MDSASRKTHVIAPGGGKVGRFNAQASYTALEAQRQSRALSWRQAALETGVSPSTLTRTRLGGRMEVDGMLAMVGWLGRTAECFTYQETKSE